MHDHVTCIEEQATQEDTRKEEGCAQWGKPCTIEEPVRDWSKGEVLKL